MSDYVITNTPATTAQLMLGSSETKGALPFVKMLMLGILAGMFIAFGAQLANLVSHNISAVGIARFAMGATFPIGLILVIMLGAELFTGNCMMLAGVVDGRIKISAMIRNWVVVYIGNLIGSLIVVGLVYLSGQLGYSADGLGAFTIKVATAKVGLGFSKAFFAGILCNILVCLAVLMGMASKTPVGKMFSAWWPVMTFVTAGFEHSIANMYYVPAGMLAALNPSYAAAANSLYGIDVATAGLNLMGCLGNLVPVTLGNIVGGCAVGLVFYYCYGRKKKEA